MSVAEDKRFEGIKPFEKKVWLSTPTMHGEELQFVQAAIDAVDPFEDVRAMPYDEAVASGLALTIDVHAILAVAALVVMLIATGSAHYASAIFLAGILLSAACTLGVTRVYLYMFMAQPKNKIAFCNFRREEADEDEE